jgi:putative peptidoglycan lipid II flippase
MSEMLKSSGAMGLATLVSRALGMVRVMVYSRFMGTTWEASAFVLAFQIPNLFRRLLGEGALTAAFIPIFKQKERQEGESAMWQAANAVISGLVLMAAVISLAVVIALTAALAVGRFQPKTTLMLGLLRVMFPYMLLVCLTAVLIGMANARGHFFVPALGAAMLNVVMIASVLGLAPYMGTTLAEQLYALAIGVLVAGVVQMLFQWPSLHREGYRYRWVSPWPNETVREVVRKMIPGSIGVAAFQINVLATQCFSYWFEPTIVASFEYAVRLMELPQGVFGISLATYLLPTLSALAAEKKYPLFRATLGQGIGYLAFANLLAASVSLVLAKPIVRLLFEGGAFGPDATERVALALACLAPGLFFFSLNNILARAFFALHDTQTPMKISVACLAINLVFALVLVQQLREAGLAVANTLSAALNVWLLFYGLRRKLARLDLAGLVSPLLMMLSAAVLAGVVAGLAHAGWDWQFGHRGLGARVGAVFVPLFLAGAVYWGATLYLKVAAALDIQALLRQRFLHP